VLEAAAVGPGTTLLDLGCGTGGFARAATDRGARVTGIDLDPAAVARAAAEVPEGVFVVGDALEPPSGQFDVVVAMQLLMHVADPGRGPGRGGAHGSGRGGDGLGPT
jgi:2-polyprenyl-3-methyl-5-hydroxy-6-metoxy-1,4-benzoquinol methylase